MCVISVFTVGIFFFRRHFYCKEFFILTMTNIVSLGDSHWPSHHGTFLFIANEGN